MEIVRFVVIINVAAAIKNKTDAYFASVFAFSRL